SLHYRKNKCKPSPVFNDKLLGSFFNAAFPPFCLNKRLAATPPPPDAEEEGVTAQSPVRFNDSVRVRARTDRNLCPRGRDARTCYSWNRLARTDRNASLYFINLSFLSMCFQTFGMGDPRRAPRSPEASAAASETVSLS
ncbi:hypothetical protein AVEN_164302-1, partial [Araneus ventricosus]